MAEQERAPNAAVGENLTRNPIWMTVRMLRCSEPSCHKSDPNPTVALGDGWQQDEAKSSGIAGGCQGREL